MGVALGASLSGAWIHRHHSDSTREISAAGLHCDSGIGAAKAHARSMVTASGGALGAPPITPINWTPKINDRKPPGPGSEGMTWIPGGEFWMGSQEDRMTDAKPWHRVYVDGYWMDKTAVTNEQFARFVKATGYVTVAERKPRAEDYRTIPKRLRRNWSLARWCSRRQIILSSWTVNSAGGAMCKARTGGIRRVPNRMSPTG